MKAASFCEGNERMLEPGLDKHLWESWWQQFDEDVQTSPAEALSELDGLNPGGGVVADRRVLVSVTEPAVTDTGMPPTRVTHAGPVVV